MLHQFGYSAADDELHLPGRSQDQSAYAAHTGLSHEDYSYSTAPRVVNDTGTSTFRPNLSWPASDQCIDPANLGLSYATGESYIGFGGSLHSDSLNTVSSRFSTSPSIDTVQSVYHRLRPGLDHFSYSSIIPRQQPIFYRPSALPETHRGLVASNSSITGMQPHRSESQIRDGDLSEDTQLTTSSTTSRKRSRDTPVDNRFDLTERLQPSSKPKRSGSFSKKRRVSSISPTVLPFQDTPTKHVQDEDHSNWSGYPTGTEHLTAKQKKFVRQWFDTFARSNAQLALPNESICALATLIQARPQIVYDYLSKTYPSLSSSSTSQSPTYQQTITTSPPQRSPEPYTLTTANAHLPPGTLSLVTKYITTCRRPRLRADGRRSVNTGPYRCTLACGYRTKRAFDWRRHEETHEPQELWLCTLCSTSITSTSTSTTSISSPQYMNSSVGSSSKKDPFLVSRKDKFLKHAKECHKEWTPDKVLELSRVDYRPRSEVGCPICGWRAEGKGCWDERCRHVLGHFEDEVEQGLRRSCVISDRGGAGGDGGGKESGEGSVADGSVVSVESVESDGSEEEG